MAKGDQWIFDKLEDREYSREEKLERFKKLVAYHNANKVGVGRKKGVVMINNGKVVKPYDADLPIPEGWVRGYIKKECGAYPKECKNEQ